MRALLEPFLPTHVFVVTSFLPTRNGSVNPHYVGRYSGIWTHGRDWHITSGFFLLKPVVIVVVVVVDTTKNEGKTFS